MNIVEEWMDHEDPLETRMFYELMQVYRHAECFNQATAYQAFEDVKAFVREHCRAEQEIAMVELTDDERAAVAMMLKHMDDGIPPEESAKLMSEHPLAMHYIRATEKYGQEYDRQQRAASTVPAPQQEPG